MIGDEKEHSYPSSSIEALETIKTSIEALPLRDAQKRELEQVLVYWYEKSPDGVKNTIERMRVLCERNPNIKDLIDKTNMGAFFSSHIGENYEIRNEAHEVLQPVAIEDFVMVGDEVMVGVKERALEWQVYALNYKEGRKAWRRIPFKDENGQEVRPVRVGVPFMLGDEVLVGVWNEANRQQMYALRYEEGEKVWRIFPFKDKNGKQIRPPWKRGPLMLDGEMLESVWDDDASERQVYTLRGKERDMVRRRFFFEDEKGKEVRPAIIRSSVMLGDEALVSWKHTIRDKWKIYRLRKREDSEALASIGSSAFDALPIEHLPITYQEPWTQSSTEYQHYLNTALRYLLTKDAPRAHDLERMRVSMIRGALQKNKALLSLMLTPGASKETLETLRVRDVIRALETWVDREGNAHKGDIENFILELVNQAKKGEETQNEIRERICMLGKDKEKDCIKAYLFILFYVFSLEKIKVSEDEYKSKFTKSELNAVATMLAPCFSQLTAKYQTEINELTEAVAALSASDTNGTGIEVENKNLDKILEFYLEPQKDLTKAFRVLRALVAIMDALKDDNLIWPLTYSSVHIHKSPLDIERLKDAEGDNKEIELLVTLRVYSILKWLPILAVDRLRYMMTHVNYGRLATIDSLPHAPPSDDRRKIQLRLGCIYDEISVQTLEETDSFLQHLVDKIDKEGIENGIALLDEEIERLRASIQTKIARFGGSTDEQTKISEAIQELFEFKYEAPNYLLVLLVEREKRIRQGSKWYDEELLKKRGSIVLLREQREGAIKCGDQKEMDRLAHEINQIVDEVERLQNRSRYARVLGEEFTGVSNYFLFGDEGRRE